MSARPLSAFAAVAAACAVLCLLAGAARAQDVDHDDHDHDGARRHRPAGVAQGGHGHAHPGFDLTHPIVTESPLPETHVRLDYGFADSGGGKEHTVAAAIEYAFTPSFSIEAALPYTLLDPPGGRGPYGRVADASFALKLATHALTDHGLLPAVGLEIVLPTGDEERGIGTDHVIELEPFVRLGWRAGRFELIGSLALGIPLNQADDEDGGLALSYNLSALYHAAADVQLLLESHGECALDGGADGGGGSVFYLSPGVTFQPFADKSITIGVGASVPVAGDDEPFDYAINLMTIVHF